MLIGGGGPDFPYPQGDPGTISAAAAALTKAASGLTTAAGQVSGAASDASSYWSGPAASAFAAGVDSVRSGLNSLAGCHSDAAAALSAYAKALSAAQTAANQAGESYSGAENRFNSTMAGLTNDPPKGPGAAQKLQNATDGAANDLQGAYNTAQHASAQACQDAQTAAAACAQKLSSISSELTDTALHKFLDLMGGPGTVFGALGITMQTKSATGLYNLLRAMDSKDYTKLEEMYPKEWQEIIGDAKPGSYDGLTKLYQFEAKVADDAFGDLAAQTTGIDAVPAGKLAGTLDVLGKVGVVAAVATDVMTMADSKSSPLDRSMAGVNLAGLALASTGSEAVGGIVATMVGADAVAAWIPGVGEVLVAATTIYFAQEWIRAHWGDIENWSGDAYHGVVDAYHGVVDGYDWVNNKVNEGLDAAGHWVGNEVTGGLHTAEHILSDINPF